MHHHHSIKQHEERRAVAAANGTDLEEEDLVDVLLRVQKEGGLDVPPTMGIIKAVILVSAYKNYSYCAVSFHFIYHACFLII